MAEMPKLTVPLEGSTAHIVLTTTRRWSVRLWLGTALLRLGARVLGAKPHVEFTDDDCIPPADKDG